MAPYQAGRNDGAHCAARSWQVVRPTTPAEFETYYDLRWRVLREPWGQPRGSERDEREAESIHLMVRDDAGNIIAVGRLHLNAADEAQIRYMAVADGDRHKGVGSLLLRSLEHSAGNAGVQCIVLDARDTVTGFYRKHGYRLVGPAHVLFGVIPHFRMMKVL